MTIPAWDCSNERDREALIKWTLKEVDRRTVWGEEPENSNSHLPSDWLSIAIEAADEGDVRMLQWLYPHLKRFLQPPRMPGRGTRRQRRDRSRMEMKKQMAKEDFELIKVIWTETFGRWKRREQPTAKQIAAKHNGLDPRTQF
jgi:hypothetical protein